MSGDTNFPLFELPAGVEMKPVSEEMRQACADAIMRPIWDNPDPVTILREHVRKLRGSDE